MGVGRPATTGSRKKGPNLMITMSGFDVLRMSVRDALTSSHIVCLKEGG